MDNLKYFNKYEILDFVKSKIKKTEVVVDIGCGIMPQKYMLPLLNICCEPFKEYRSILQEKMEKDFNSLHFIFPFDWKQTVERLPQKSVDTIFLLDIVEHLEKDEGLALLKLTEKIARKQIIIFTPLGFLPQNHTDGIDAWGLHGGEWQEHKSGWRPEDFDQSWDFYICEDFHEFDNSGKKFEIPYGAFWAIKNIVTDEIFQRIDHNFFNLTGYNINDFWETNSNKIFDIIKQHSELQSSHAELQSSHAELQSSHAELQKRFDILYNSTFSKLDRTLNRYPFARFIIRTAFRVVRLPFKIKRKIFK